MNYKRLRQLSDEQIAVLEQFGIDTDALSDDDLLDVRTLTPEELARIFSFSKGFARRLRHARIAERLWTMLVLAISTVIGLIMMRLCNEPGTIWASNSMVIYAFFAPVFGCFSLLLIDFAFPQYNIYELLKTHITFRIAFVGYLSAFVCAGMLVGYGTNVGSGTATNPREPLQFEVTVRPDSHADTLQ